MAVIVSVFNKARFVAETLRSLLRQSYENIEVIIVNDGSTDDSADIVRRTLGDYPFRLVELANGGVSRARNTGAAEASPEAKYLFFLDADDLLAENMIGLLVEHLEGHPEAAACYSRLRYVDVQGLPLSDPPSDHRWARTAFGRQAVPDSAVVTPLEAVWTRFWAIPSSCVMRRSSFEATTGWDTNLCPPANRFTSEDKDMAIQLTLEGELHRLPERLVDYRVMPSSHQAALYEGLKALNVKWWSADMGTDVEAQVRRAIRFDYRVTAFDAVSAFVAALRHPMAEDLAANAGSLVRALARWALTTPRMYHWSRTAG